MGGDTERKRQRERDTGKETQGKRHSEETQGQRHRERDTAKEKQGKGHRELNTGKETEDQR